MTKVRCAIYTRKSSEEGLEQDFNSLDAQREACGAYVLSQASEGWTLLPDVYDDGGISGGTLQRPALQRLLADVAAGKIDIIVVYKVDRLTRSLLDFAKLVEALDKAGTSFVSVTQSFNTTTSMGRLTLNMLLSFAQFEREVTAERIRDKIAASKAKGMWMGGTPPLGYRPDGRSLAIVDEHAAIIRDIYRRYLALGSVRLLEEELKRQAIRVPRRQSGSGKPFGGGVFTRGQIYFILRNATYAGRIVHKDRTYPGQHAAIIGEDTWDRAQQLLAANRQGEQRARQPHRSLLAGLIIDAAGEAMLATHASKHVQGKVEGGKVRYRYYVSHALQAGVSKQGLRLPAREIETVVKEQIAAQFDDPLLLASQLALEISPALLRRISEPCADMAAQLRSRTAGPLRTLVRQVRALDGKMEVALDVASLVRLIGCENTDPSALPLTLIIPFRLTRTGQALRLVQENGAFTPGPANTALINMVVQANTWWGMLAGGEIDVRTLARREGVNEAYLTRVMRAAFLSPHVTEAILAGRQNAEVTAAGLRDPGSIPIDWHEQARTFLPAAVGAGAR